MSKDDKKSGIHINRRSFLKGIATTGAMATIAAGHPATAAQSTRNNETGTKSWRDKPDPIPERLISDGGTYDVVVVGGGNSGTYCMSAAANKGASVAVIENQAEDGYLPGAGKDVAHINSQYGLSQGVPRIDEDDFLREWARRNVICHNPKRASYYVKHSGRIFDWVISFAPKGWIDDNCHIMSCPPKPGVLMEVSGWKFYYGAAIFLNKNETSGRETWPEIGAWHRERAEAHGVKWFFEHHAEICDLDSSGAVTGVVAKRADGKYVRFNARKGVALCAGGFAHNREMILDILDTIRHKAEARGDLSLVRAGGMMMSIGGKKLTLMRDGSGIKLGIWAGGHIEIGPRSGSSGEPGAGEWHIQLDQNGERFHDEAAGSSISQPGDHWTITIHDARWKEVLAARPPYHGGPDTAFEYTWSSLLSRLDNIKPGPPSRGGTIFCADTIEELLDYMDCYKGETRKKALAEIKRYNEMCKKGIDEDFGKDRRIMKLTELKDPPFYATVNRGARMSMMAISAGMFTPTGLDTDAEGRVLNSEFKPIMGLYAAGNNAGNRYIVRYQTPMSGMSIGMAMTEGCLLGEMLADL